MGAAAAEKIFPDDADRLMTLDEVGARLGTGRGFAMDLVKLQFIPAVRFGRQTRISKFQLNDFIERVQNQDLWDVVQKAKAKLKS